MDKKFMAIASKLSKSYDACKHQTHKKGYMAELPKLGEFCWNELATPNVQAAKDFYGKVFGWEFADHAMGDTTYTMAKMHNKEIAGLWAIPKDKTQEIPPHWMAYILVENVEESLQRAVKAGAKIIKGETHAGDFGKLAIIQDPTGAYVAIWQPSRK